MSGELTITAGKGFQLKFENGWTASVQWGGGNYCDNYTHPIGQAGSVADEYGNYNSENAEIAAWPKDGEFVKFQNGDQVKGYVEADEVADFIAWVKAQPAS